MTNYEPTMKKYRPLIYVFNEQGIKLLFAFSIPFPWYGKYSNPERFELPITGWHIRYFKRGIALTKEGKWQEIK